MKKRSIVFGLTMVLSIVVWAGDLTHSLGIQVGWDREIYRLNAPSLSGKDKKELSKTPLSGGRLGLVYELADESGVGLFTAINYAYTWSRSAYEKIPYTPEGKPAKIEWSKLEYSCYLQSHRVDFIVQPEFKFEIAGRTYLIFYTGPTFQVIASLQAEDRFRYNDETAQVRYYFEDKLNYNSEVMTTYYKNWNITWGLGAAFQYDIFYLRGGYDFGLVNPYKVQDFGAITIENAQGVPYSIFTEPGSNEPDHRLTRGRLDCWNVTFGVYFWQKD